MSMPESLQEDEETTAVMDDGAGIVLRRHGAHGGERILISHGNGLAIDAFARFRDALLARGFEVVAFDMRNHGRNEYHASDEPNWARFIRDFPAKLAAIDARFGPKPTYGAFHSLSSAVCLLSQAQAPYPWRSLTLFEPPVPAAPGTDLHDRFIEYHVRLSQRARQRRARFDTPDQLAVSMRRSSLFALVPDEDIARLARATLRQDGNGWVPRCPPAFEAATFRIDALDPLRPSLAAIDCPVRVVVGDARIHYADVLVGAGEALSRDFGFELVTLPRSTHFMQLERPEACARLVAGGRPAPGDLDPPRPTL